MTKELIERMRGFEIDHEPDGWPAIRMREVSALCDALEKSAQQPERAELDFCDTHCTWRDHHPDCERAEPVDLNPATFLRLIETVKYLVGIAERGEGRKLADNETPEQFVLGYVKRLERAEAVVEQKHETMPMIAAILPNGATASNVYEAYEEGRKSVQPVQEPVAITDCMVYAFSNALSDCPLGEDDFKDIKAGLRAAFANIYRPDQTAEIERLKKEPILWKSDFHEARSAFNQANEGWFQADKRIATLEVVLREARGMIPAWYLPKIDAVLEKKE